MKDSRIGETLWSEWSGEGYYAQDDAALVFFTNEHVDVENEVVRRALASALQRDGSVHSLGEGYAKLDDAKVATGYAGEIDGERELTACSIDGETSQGDYVEDVLRVTWVEIL